jgi:HD superfamily phosphodiesterase
MTTLDEIYRLSEPYWQTRKNEIHVPLVFRYAQQLLEHYPEADPAVVLPAALMHDNGWFMVPAERLAKAFGPKASDLDANRLHEVEGVRIAGEILGTLGYDAAKIDEILAIIDGHDSRATALSLNDKLVKDADKMWRFDPIGFEIDHSRFGISWQEHAGFLETHMELWLFTPEARALARKNLARVRQKYTASNEHCPSPVAQERGQG